MLIDLTKPGFVSLQEVGGKAFNLHKLANMGIPVPGAIAVPAALRDNEDLYEELRGQIQQHGIVLRGNRFAVRSSGVGEDSEGNSCAGIFESYLDVPQEGISGVSRISRKGADDIPSALLKEMADLLMPLIEKIEEEYAMPVDIEWAIMNDEPYILQARPVTV